MRILHTSDLHLTPQRLVELLTVLEGQDFDMWLDTGDFLPSLGRKAGDRVDPEAEVTHQRQFASLKRLAARFAERLDGRPLVSIPGNHCYVKMADVIEGVHEVTPDGIEVAGVRIAGFRNVPYIADEWVGETQSQDLRQVVERVLASGATIMANHAPVAGILDEPGNRYQYGVPQLSTSLFYQPHGFTHIFHGHAHVSGGQTMTEAGMKFINGAGHARIHTV